MSRKRECAKLLGKKIEQIYNVEFDVMLHCMEAQTELEIFVRPGLLEEHEFDKMEVWLKGFWPDETTLKIVMKDMCGRGELNPGRYLICG